MDWLSLPLRIAKRIVIGGVFGALGGMLLLWFLGITAQFVIPFLGPVSREEFTRLLITAVFFPFTDPLDFEPGVGLVTGIGIGLIAGIRDSRTLALIARSILGGSCAMIARLIYFTRMPSPSPSEFASLVLIGIGFAFLDLIVGGGFRFILRQLKNKSS